MTLRQRAYLVSADAQGPFRVGRPRPITLVHKEPNMQTNNNSVPLAELLPRLNAILEALGGRALPNDTTTANLLDRLDGQLAVLIEGSDAEPELTAGGFDTSQLAMANRQRLAIAQDIAKRRGLTLAAALRYVP